MYAIIKSGGKQHRVEEGDVIDLELLGVEEGKVVIFEEVLFVNDGKNTFVGAPNLEGYIVEGEVLGTVKGPKVVAFKYKRRKDTQRKVGHRQSYSRVKITAIQEKEAAITA